MFVFNIHLWKRYAVVESQRIMDVISAGHVMVENGITGILKDEKSYQENGIKGILKDEKSYQELVRKEVV